MVRHNTTLSPPPGLLVINGTFCPPVSCSLLPPPLDPRLIVTNLVESGFVQIGTLTEGETLLGRRVGTRKVLIVVSLREKERGEGLVQAVPVTR